MKSFVSSYHFNSLLDKINSTKKLSSIKSLCHNIPNSGGRIKGTIVAPRIKHYYPRYYRYIDFKRFNLPETSSIVLQAIYDPLRTCKINLICYPIGIFSYILAPSKLLIGDCIKNNTKTPFKYGDSSELIYIPAGRLIHNVRGMARSAGNSIILVRKELDKAMLKLKSTELRFLPLTSIGTIGICSNGEKIHSQIGSAGRGAYLKKRRPRTRPSAMNPVDHPMGGRTRGGAQPVNCKGKIMFNFSTVKKHNKNILYTKRQLKLLK